MNKLDKNMALLDEIIDILRLGEKLDRKYEDHALTGDLLGFRECHILSDWLLVYMIEKDVLTLTLSQTGSHSEIFKK